MNNQLIKNEKLAQDEWQIVLPPDLGEDTVRKQAGKVVLFKLAGEETYTANQISAVMIPEQGKLLLPLSVFIRYQEALQVRLQKGEVGIILATHETIANLLEVFPDLNRLPVIAVMIGRFSDGRAFSLATLLRTRYQFQNELRAIGDVLRDQIFFFKRVGFNSFLIRSDRSAEDALPGLRDFSLAYQCATDHFQPSWKRVKRQ